MSSTTGQELDRAGQQRAERMLGALNSTQYEEDLSDNRVREAVGALVLRTAQRGVELTPAGIDFSVEAFSRHGLSQEEMVALNPDVEVQTAEELEDHLRRQHVALELLRDNFDLKSEARGDDRELARLRIDAVRSLMDLVTRTEELSGEKVDEESLAQLADEFRQWLSFTGRQFKSDVRSALEILQDASEHQLLGFLAHRYFRAEPTDA